MVLDNMEINKAKYKIDSKLILIIVSAALYFSLWIFSGLDITDTGHHLLKQKYLFNGDYSYIDLIFGSNLAGRLWNNILDRSFILWSRIGYVFISLLSLIFSYLALRKIFKPEILILPFFVNIVFFTQNIHLIHYYSFPMFITAIIFYLLILILQEERKKRVYYAIFIGFLLGFVTISSFPKIILLIIPILIIIYYKFILKESDFCYKNIYNIFIGFLCFLALIGIFSYFTNYLDNYFQVFYNRFIRGFILSESPASGGHTIHYQINKWGQEYLILFLFILIYMITTLIISYLSNRSQINKKSKKIIYLITVLIPIPLMFIKIRGVNSILGDGSLNFSISKNLLSKGIIPNYAIPAFIILTFILFYKFYDSNKYNQKLINLSLIISIIIMVIFPLGSNTFANKFKYGYRIAALPLALVLCIKMRNIGLNGSKSRFIHTFSKLGTKSIIPLITLGFLSQFFGAYRDHPNRCKLTAKFNHPSLKYIKSTKERTETFDEVLELIYKNSTKKDNILCMGKIPMIYYLTDRKPYISSPWPSTLSIDKFSRKLNNNAIRGLPKLIIITKYDVGDRFWPNTSKKYLAKKPHLNILKKFIAENNYNSIWENKIFKVYKIN